MTEAWRPFSDEEMRKIIEGERMVVNGLKEDLSPKSLMKQGSPTTRVFRGRPFKRAVNGNQRISDNSLDSCTQTHCDKKVNSKPSLDARIPKILEEKEEEDEGCDLVEPVLRCDSVELSSQHRTTDIDDALSISSRASNVDVISLEEFQEKQKVMEEQNRMNKELLQRALSDRAKKTREEAQKLNHIEEELKKLDNMLTNDVTIIRNQIEVASQEYLEAQKRYDRAEKEYIAAKMNLYTYKEKKELLTSHLCTIIEKNELRKAQKLSDLMRKLEMGMDISCLTLDENDLKNEDVNSLPDPSM